MGWSSWQALAGSLKGLQYHPEAEDPWLRLGIYPVTSSAPTACLLEQRWRVARILLEAARNTVWPDGDRRASAVATDRLAVAYSLCLERLPAAPKDRKKKPKQACPRWAEAGAELIRVIQHTRVRGQFTKAFVLIGALWHE